MKKLVVLMLALCMVFAGVISYMAGVPTPVQETAVQGTAAAGLTEDESELNGEVEDAAAAEPAYKGLDMDAIYALHGTDEVVLTLGSREVTWGEYFHYLSVQAAQLDNYFIQMSSYYGQAVDWDQMATEEFSFSQLVSENAVQTMLQIEAIAAYAEENGVELTEEDLAAIQQNRENDMAMLLGEGVQDEALFEEKLKETRMSPELYEHLNRVDRLFNRGYIQRYGENGELADPQEVAQWLEENDYMNASHILFMTIDPATGEALDEAIIAEKQSQAEELAAELAAIADQEEKVRRFAEEKVEKCEDTGKVDFPDGYTFTAGTMVPEFEEAVNALKAYEISSVVETSYGFHIIMKLPLSADSKVLTSNGQSSGAAKLYCEDAYNNMLLKQMEKYQAEFIPTYEEISFADYVIK